MTKDNDPYSLYMPEEQQQYVIKKLKLEDFEDPLTFWITPYSDTINIAMPDDMDGDMQELNLNDSELADLVTLLTRIHRWRLSNKKYA